MLGARCLVQWHVRHSFCLKGLIDEWREKGILTRLREPYKWYLGGAEISKIVHKLNFYKWGIMDPWFLSDSKRDIGHHYTQKH